MNVTCAPASGSMFSIGETIVTCTAVDAIARQATCTFGVTLRHRQLALTNYLAFGDSMTEGENGQRINFVPIVDHANSYPTLLQQLFASRIPGQTIVVTNAGRGGERVTENEDRLKQTLDTVRPQVMLFLEGANDMLASFPAPVIAEGVRESIKRARDRGVQYVFVSTLLPVVPENCPVPDRFPCKSVPPGLPAATNQLIRAMVPANGAYLVDPYDEFVANSRTYISGDGLHLTAEGNRALASAFWNRIVAVIPARQLGLRRFASLRSADLSAADARREATPRPAAPAAQSRATSGCHSHLQVAGIDRGDPDLLVVVTAEHGSRAVDRGDSGGVPHETAAFRQAASAVKAAFQAVKHSSSRPDGIRAWRPAS